MAKPAPEAGHAADAKASHTTANTLPAYNTRRFAQEEPERLRLMPLPWANKEPDRPAPTEPPRPQKQDKRLDITGVGRLKEWKGVESAVKSIQKDLTHSDDPRHRPRRAEGGVDAEILAPLIGDTILDTRAAQGKGGTIDWTKVTVQDWTTPTPNAAKHTNIAARATNFKDKEILYEWEHGVRDTSTCSNSVRVSSHHSGVYEHQKQARKPHAAFKPHPNKQTPRTGLTPNTNAPHKHTPPQVTDMLSKEKDYYDGPYKQMPFVGGRALPVQVVVQIRPDGTLKFRICRDGGWLKDGDAPNECIDMDVQPALILVRIQDIAQAGAIMKSSGSRVWFWVIDLVGAYRQLTKAQCDIHKQVFLWYNTESGDMEFWVDLRCYFGDRIMVHKFSRIANFVVFCVLEEISERDDHRNPRELNLQQWLAERKAKLGPEQAVLTYCAMYIDDLSGISVGENDTRARQDYASAVHVIEDVIGLKAQLEHGKESPPTETTVDLLGATFDIPASDLDASDRFKGKATTKLRQSRDEGQWNLVGCESATYTCNHAAQLSITEGRAHLHHFFVEMRRLRRNSGRKQRISRVCMEEIEWWIAEIPKVRHVPWAPALFFPERGHPRRVDPEMDASGNIGFGAACPLPGGIVLFFYGKWTQQELELHINEKEALASYWALVLFGNVTPAFCANMRYTRVYANERIDNTVAISVGHKNSGKSWRLTKLAQKRAEAARFNGWICSQEYIYTKDNDLSDPLSRDDVELFRRNAYKRGLTIMIHVELDDTVRDTSFLFEVVSRDTQDTTHTDKQTRIDKHTNTKLTKPTHPPTPTRRARHTRPRQDQRRSDDA